MKTKFSIFVVFIALHMVCLSHQNENVHQRIVQEAYKLLKLQFSKDKGGFANFDQFLGEIREHKDYYWYNVRTLTGGSDHEDRKDIVFGYEGIRDHIFWGEYSSHTSATHFWTVDNPSYKVYLHSWGYFESAYVKALKYIWDDYPKIFINPHQWGETWGYIKQTCGDVPGRRQYPKDYLYSWYWKDKIWVNEEAKYALGNLYSKRGNFYDLCGNLKCQEIFFNILGRLSHLLTDMGVPEHAKNSMHPNEHNAPFEHWIGHSDYYRDEFLWNAQKVYKERGGFVNPFCEMNNGDKNLYLFYTTAQLSDWFACYGYNPREGNNAYKQNIGEIKSIINSYFPDDPNYYNLHPGDWGIIYGKRWDLTDTEGRIFRDALIPYTIRAVAGLLYKFIIEAKMQNRYGAPSEDAAGTIYDQQQELNLFNQDINGDYYTFRAEGTPGRITVCPDVIPEGYTRDFLIGPDTRNVTFRAANEIVFKPGFTATHGSQVHAYTCKDCSRENQNNNCQQCLDEDYNPQYDRSK